MNDKILYSPWRMSYILSKKSDMCIFCIKMTKTDLLKNNDEKNNHIPDQNIENIDKDHLVVYRSNHSFVLLNLYPYNNGHVMVVSNNHVATLTDLTKEELTDLFHTVQLCEKVMNNIYKPDGINIGLNIGKAAGAGIDDHLHVHLVPRWFGDNNFMTAISGTRVIPEDFYDTFSKFKKGFDDVIISK